ncbi:glycosyltransferase, partial [Paenibacillus sp. KS1]|uniref:glycosyltransferase n=1 Tax=Paenibacillus sp. KS1 TaxID=1849249 RepID=UPI000A98154B
NKTYFDNWPSHVQKDYEKRCKIVSQADSILTISEASKKDIINYLNVSKEKVTVVNASTDENLFNNDSNSFEDKIIKDELGLNEPFIYSLTGYDPRKNNKGLINSFSRLNKLQPTLNLVISGIKQEVERTEFLEYASKIGADTNKIHFLGYISNDCLVALYKKCELFVFPSLYEGFGLPLLEAMRCGAPVVTIKNSCLPEVTGEDYPGLVDDEEGLADRIHLLLQNNSLRLSAISMGSERASCFSWNKTAIASKECFDNLLGSSFISSETTKPILAYVSPLNPQQSGISDYSEELLPFLKEFFDIKVICNKIRPSNVDILNQFDVIDISENKNYLENIKNRIYHIGNNSMHEWIYEELEKYPGVVVLHDLNLFGFNIYSTHLKGDTKQFKDNLYYCHGSEGLTAANLLIDNQTYPDDQTFPMFQKVIDLSTGTIVHNKWMQEKIKFNSTFKGEIGKIPLGLLFEQHEKVNNDDLKKELNIPQFDVLLGVFGHVIPNKRIEVILKSFSELLKTNPNVGLFIVGHASDEIKKDLKKKIQALNLQKNIICVFSPPLDVFEKYIQISDICINLRWPTMGESSAALMRSLGNGIPCIVSNVGSYREFPDDFVWKVDVDNFEIPLLTAYLLELCNNKLLIEDMGNMAREYMLENHDFKLCAEEYRDVILGS